MKTDEVKRLLQVYRPGGQDAADPEFAEALEAARKNPDLARWFAEEQAFDAVLSRSLKEPPVPADLKESILADRKVVRLSPWWNARPRIAAVAAALAMLLGLAGFWVKHQSTSFAGFRNEIIQLAWNSDQHLEFRSSDLRAVRDWLDRNQAAGDFELPNGLRNLPAVGARILDWQGHKVGLVCFLDGPMHMHLFVMDRTRFADTPLRDSPQFEDCGVWKTVSWSQSGKTYVLTGMTYQTIVKKFRKSGQWMWTG